MLREAIYHRSWGSYAYLLNSETLKISLRAKKADLKSCQLVHGEPWEPSKPLERQLMNKVASDDLFDYFSVNLRVPSSRSLRYAFMLDDGSDEYWYTEAGVCSRKPELKDLGLPFFEFLYIRENDVFSTPDWAREAVFYQIFPERFFNGDRTNDPPNAAEWGKLPLTNETFYGGDLRGIIEKLPYLGNLGVNAIYLTPIFSSPSTHKYDTRDYYQIDSHFGDLQTFKELVSKCHQADIRVILDGVFDHCGYEFWAFQDVVQKGPESRYKEWFRIHSFPIMTKPRPTYETWGRNIWILPRLMTSNPEVKKYLIEVAVHWIKEADIDGWRLDTASEIDHDFWRDFRRAVRAAKPEALIIGEIPHDASPWLDGDQLDSVMNYAFRDAVIDFFAKNRITSEEFDARLARLRMQYKQQANEVLYNLLGSHDTIRFLAACDNRIERMACALIFQMTYVGMPVVYYGDEVGMTSDTSNWEDCRRTMIWNETEQDKELLEFHKKLLHIRRTHVALAHGDFSAIDVDPKKSAYAYLRHAQDQKILVILNNSPEPQSAAVRTEEVGSIPGHVLVDLLTDEHHQIRDDQVMITLKPYTGAILSELT